jgi:hypothetical protein
MDTDQQKTAAKGWLMAGYIGVIIGAGLWRGKAMHNGAKQPACDLGSRRHGAAMVCIGTVIIFAALILFGKPL